MDVLAAVFALLVGAFVVGLLARFALPGPDPLPVSLTAALGLGGSALGIGVAAVLGFGLGGSEEETSEALFVFFLSSFAGATLLLVLFRRVVQKRPVAGPRAERRPRRPRGLLRVLTGRSTREPEPVDDAPPDGRTPLDKLTDLRDAGTISPEEFEKRRAAFGDPA